jgi:hypothetical protein
MAKKKKKEHADTKPQFPYTTSLASLRKLLKKIPDSPKPSKLTLDVLKTWNVTSSNDASPLRVLKDLGMLGSAGEPLAPYVAFMQPTPVGPAALGSLIKQKYSGLFEASHEPHKNSETLKKYFNIHAGGSPATIDLQIQTFKALCEYAVFQDGPTTSPAISGGAPATSEGGNGNLAIRSLPPIKIDLHIHLPENKTTRDYEAIIQDIAKYIYGRSELTRE